MSTWVNETSLQQVSGGHQEKLDIWQYRSAMNSPELPNYYHILLLLFF